MVPEIQEALEGICEAKLAEDVEGVVKIKYPFSYKDEYVQAEVKLEIGALALWLPNQTHTIQSYASEALPHVFSSPACEVNVVAAKRTFWEKVTILHQEAHRPADKAQPLRYSRHYYDLAQMAESEVKAKSLADIEMLRSVVEFKQKYYPRTWACYERAKPGTIKLKPDPQYLSRLEQDYAEMEVMFFGKYPSFQSIQDNLAVLEREINEIKVQR